MAFFFSYCQLFWEREKTCWDFASIGLFFPVLYNLMQIFNNVSSTILPWSQLWASSWDCGTYYTGDQRRLRQACASAQSCQSLRCSHTWSMEIDEEFDQKSDILCHCVWRIELTEDEKYHNLMRWLIYYSQTMRATVFIFGTHILQDMDTNTERVLMTLTVVMELFYEFIASIIIPSLVFLSYNKQKTVINIKFKISTILVYAEFQGLSTKHLSCLMTKPTKWHVCPAKTQISLAICTVWSVFAVRRKKPWILSYP